MGFLIMAYIAKNLKKSIDNLIESHNKIALLSCSGTQYNNGILAIFQNFISMPESAFIKRRKVGYVFNVFLGDLAM